jgi:hypothetical protein
MMRCCLARFVADRRTLANPSILLPQQVCKIHKYRDPRPRDEAKTMWAIAGYTKEQTND